MPEPAPPKPLVLPPLLYGGFLAAGIILHLIVPWRAFGRWGIGLAAGALLVAAGAALLVWAVCTFQPVGGIVEHGPYAHTRNPMYLAFALVYFGVALAVNSLWPVALLPVVLGTLHYGVIRIEESYLEARFGDAYAAYRTRVRRWL